MNTRVIPIRPSGLILPSSTGLLSEPPVDTLGRNMRDLRISVTDRCNFRCSYCMPKTVFNRDFKFMPHDSLLSFEEIERVAKIFVDQGVQKIRITGGEPLLRKNIERLIEKLAQLPVELTMTTNASLLARKAQSLKDAGLQRVTVSLDALDDETFKKMNDMDFPVSDVLEGIAAAVAVGLGPVKINMVVKRGVNEHAILPMVRYFKGSGQIVRFIEYMDVGASNGWKMDEVMPSREIVELINAELPIEPANPNYRGEVAKRWKFKDGSGEVGVISSVTEAFCSSCTRLRLSPEGSIYTCLFAQRGNDIRTLLRGGSDDETITRVIQGVWQQRGDRYSEIRTADTAAAKKIEMSYIGG
ncbi:MAG TPA: GTP 3',8-cyclase MoaA [Rhodocyclaceae bacterium]|nr:GTP 3',8-cyclase MoaA [Rhodocyclaceae bacterium]